MMSLNKLFAGLFACIIFASCGDKCKDAEDSARAKYRDPALTFLWRYTNNLVSSTDSGYYTFKSNGDFNISPNVKEVGSWYHVWYSDKNTISTSYCEDMSPKDDAPAYKYAIQHDTLFLYPYSSTVKGFLTTPKTLIKVSDY